MSGGVGGRTAGEGAAPDDPPEPEITLELTAYTPRTDAEGRPERRVLPHLPVINPCRTCPARCCKMTVQVSLPDVLVYCHTLQVPFFAGVTVVPGQHPEHAFALGPDPRFVRGEEAWPGSGELQLRRREDGRCHGLVDVGGYERCGVYEARPSTCRVYPVMWSGGGARGGPAALVCPVPYAVTPGEEARLLADARRARDAWALHAEVVRAWNQNAPEAASVEDFLRFAVPRVAERLGLPWQEILASGSPDERLWASMVSAGLLPAPRLGLGVQVESQVYAGLARQAGANGETGGASGR